MNVLCSDIYFVEVRIGYDTSVIKGEFLTKTPTFCDDINMARVR